MFDNRLPVFLPLFSASMLFFAASGNSRADVLTVDDDDPAADFATIQEAVDVAMDGDRIEVGPGYYFADSKSLIPVVVIDGKSIEIVAINVDPAMTVIAGQGIRRCVEWSDADGSCKLDGFTLDSGYSDTDGGGLLIDRSHGDRWVHDQWFLRPRILLRERAGHPRGLSTSIGVVRT